LQLIIQLVDKFNKAVTVLLGIMASVMFLLIFGQVVFRYVFNFSLSWSEEVARYLMIWSVCIGSALALRRQSMSAMQFLAEKLTHRSRTKLKIFVYSLCLVFFAMMFYYGLEMMEIAQYQRSPATQVKMAVPYAGIPIGAAVLFLNGIAVILEMILNLKEPGGKEV